MTGSEEMTFVLINTRTDDVANSILGLFDTFEAALSSQGLTVYDELEPLGLAIVQPDHPLYPRKNARGKKVMHQPPDLKSRITDELQKKYNNDHIWVGEYGEGFEPHSIPLDLYDSDGEINWDSDPTALDFALTIQEPWRGIGVDNEEAEAIQEGAIEILDDYGFMVTTTDGGHYAFGIYKPWYNQRYIDKVSKEYQHGGYGLKDMTSLHPYWPEGRESHDCFDSAKVEIIEDDMIILECEVCKKTSQYDIASDFARRNPCSHNHWWLREDILETDIECKKCGVMAKAYADGHPGSVGHGMWEAPNGGKIHRPNQTDFNALIDEPFWLPGERGYEDEQGST